MIDSKENTKTLMKIIEVNKFNEDMELIEEYSKLIRKTIKKITLEKEFYIEDLQECSRIINFIWGYANIIRKNDLISARNYLRTGIANGSTMYLDNISQELKNILDNDRFWNEEIDKTQAIFQNDEKIINEEIQRDENGNKKFKSGVVSKEEYLKFTGKKNLFEDNK